ncbi:MAG: hypothetical protein ACR2K6_04150 [Solirubrobacterales bacterium]
MLLLGSVLAAWAPSFGAFATGHIIQGLATVLLLITTAPALILGWPTRRLRYSAVVMNLGIFGAVALGPVIGGAFVDGWRELFWIVAAISGVAVALSLLTFTDKEPGDRDTPVDLFALGGSAAGCALAFFGASQLLNNSFLDPIVIVPIVVGVAMIVVVIVHQAQISDPLMPLREAGQTLAVARILVAMVAGAVSIGAVELVRIAIGSGLLGLGVDAAVAPALFMAGFSMKSDRLPRIFAMIELLRGVAAFLVAPFLIHVAESAATTRAGVETGLWISLGITVAGIVALAALWFGSGSKLRTPDPEPWLNGDQPAVPPEPLFARPGVNWSKAGAGA